MSGFPAPSENISDQPQTPGDVSRIAQVLIILLAAVLHYVALGNAKPLQSANDRSRWSTVWSLVERGTFQIDEIRQRPGWDTIDLVRVDGHYYSTKPPLLTSIVAGITWCVQRITGWNLIDHLQSLTFAVLLIVNVIPFIVSLLVWVAILNRVSDQSWTRLIGLTMASFGTLQSPFLMTLNNHTVAATSLTFALYALLRILDEQENCPRWVYGLCGIASAWGVVNELPAALFFVFALFLSFRKSARLTLIYFVPAAAIPLVGLLITNVIATGSWKPTYADYGTEKYRFVVDGIPSYWMNPQGIDRNLDSPWAYFWHCIIGHHGIFSLSPIALLALAGWCRFGASSVASSSQPSQEASSDSHNGPRRDLTALRTLLSVGLLTTVVVIAFYMTRTQNYNYGGVSCGLRWAIWLIPLWILATSPVLDLWGRIRPLRFVTLLLLSVSIYSAWEPIDNPWRHPWLFQLMEARGWINYSEPRVKLERPLWTWFESIPQLEADESGWIEFTSLQPGLPAKRIRLTSRLASTSTPSGMRTLEIRESGGVLGSTERVRNLLINPEKFHRGDSPAEFLMWTDRKVTAVEQQEDLAFVRGLPRKVGYDARVVRYLKTPLRPEALRCVQAAAHVSYSETDQSEPLIYRCDTWLSREVPFGVAQVEFRISDTRGVILFQERWTVSNCYPKVPPFDPATVIQPEMTR